MKNILFTLSATPTHENLFFISKILFSHSLIPTAHGITNKSFLFFYFFIILWLSPTATTRPKFPSIFFLLRFILLNFKVSQFPTINCHMFII